MTNPAPKVEEGGWTPALQQMALDIIDEILSRPITSVISDTRNGTLNTFQGIREKLIKKKYGNLNDWNQDMNLVFTAAQNSPEQLVKDIGAEINQFFEKKYKLLEEFSNFKFRTAISRIIDQIDECQTKMEETK